MKSSPDAYSLSITEQYANMNTCAICQAAKPQRGSDSTLKPEALCPPR